MAVRAQSVADMVVPSEKLELKGANWNRRTHTQLLEGNPWYALLLAGLQQGWQRDNGFYAMPDNDGNPRGCRSCPSCRTPAAK